MWLLNGFTFTSIDLLHGEGNNRQNIDTKTRCSWSGGCLLKQCSSCDIFTFWNHKLMIHQDWVTHTKAEHNLFHIGQREGRENAREREREWVLPKPNIEGWFQLSSLPCTHWHSYSLMFWEQLPFPRFKWGQSVPICVRDTCLKWLPQPYSSTGPKQNKAKQNKTKKPNKRKQNKTKKQKQSKQNKTKAKQNKTKQSKTKQSKAKQNKQSKANHVALNYIFHYYYIKYNIYIYF